MHYCTHSPGCTEALHARIAHTGLPMHRFSISFFIALIVLSSPTASAQPKEIIGYFPSWKWNSRANLVSAERIPFDKLTTVNYAFFVPLPNGEIVGKDTVGDRLYLRSGSGHRLTDLAHRHGTKVLLSIGGWEGSDNFPAIAASASRRAVFAKSCMAALAEFDFDGLDIDWEYPGYADHQGTPNDKHNFTLLLRALRDSLDERGQNTGKTYLLTAALPAGTSMVANIALDTVSMLLDRLNIMTYDFHGPWDSVSDHNSPLYPSKYADSTLCVDAAFRLYRTTYGVPSAKINLGVPFYGHTFTHCTALQSTHRGADTTHFSAAGTFYYDIFRLRKSFTRYWDDQAKVPYLISPAWELFVSYDDEESVRAKAQYVLDHNACGVIAWEITGDFLEDGSTPLLDAIGGVLRNKR
jgi:chitinase